MTMNTAASRASTITHAASDNDDPDDGRIGQRAMRGNADLNERTQGDLDRGGSDDGDVNSGDLDDLDDGPPPTARSRSDRRQVRTRRCAVTRTQMSAEHLLRFVLDPADAVVPDLKASLPGRGLWLSVHRDTVDEAIRRKVFARGFKKKVAVSSDLGAQVGALLCADMLRALGLANKAGVVVCGHEKVASKLRSQAISVVLHASDAARDGQEKLNAAAHRQVRQETERLRAVVTVLNLVPRQELGAALGRPNVVHAGLSDHALTRTFLATARRYARYTGLGSEFDAAAFGAAAKTE
ncbi:MAG: RNA-binding protein [Pseudomonadota bacterium]